MDYQKTVNLPQTEFSMRANLTQKEPALLEKWKKEGLYSKIRAKSAGKNNFILHDGPPYANGNIHIGHALNKILKDIIVKFRTMEGYDSHYVPGWDCHGLPIEHQLLKELKKSKSEVDCVDFRKKAHEYAMKYVGIQREEFKRLGIFGDWDNPYLTLTPDYEYWILQSLANLNKQGYIYRGLKPVNWCFNCETALAEAEVEYEDIESPSVYVKFKVENPQIIKGLPLGKDVYLVIWTTTPWTLLANMAVAVNPSYKYKFVEDSKDGILIVEDSCYLPVKWREKGAYPSVLTLDGKMLEGLKYFHPFFETSCPVVMGDYVTKEEGTTGLVHIAPGHGQEDFQIGVKYNLQPIRMPVNGRGVYTKEAGKYEGKHVSKVNDEIIEELNQRGVLYDRKKLFHSYPHCWRCKKPVIFRATEQWFLKIDHKNLRGQLVEAIKSQVKWIPPAGQERILGMVTGRPDWCLSRQRYWGVPIPAVACKGCDGKYKLFTEVIEHFAAIVKKEGTNAWFEKDIKDLIPKNLKCPQCNKSDFDKTSDILDVWFDSGVSHQAVVKSMMQKPLPADMYLEGSDQHRGWFQSSLIPAVAMEGKPPFAAVLTHGFVVDGSGRKMSKSLGNVIAPQDVLKNNGADILRLWVMASNYHEDIRVSPEILERLIDAYRKVRNTVRYLLGNLNDFDPDEDEVPYEELFAIDKWALRRLEWTVNYVKKCYDNYEFNNVYKSLFAFCNEDLSSFYLDILKDRLYTSAAKSQERRAAQSVLFHVLNHVTRLLAPVLSFTSEEIFSLMPKNAGMKNIESVHLLEWFNTPPAWFNETIDDKFKRLLDLRPHVLKSLEDKRTEGAIGSSLDAKIVFETASDQDFEYLMNFKSDLRFLFIVSQADVVKVASVAKGLSDAFPKLQITIAKADGQKCSRCWNYSGHVGENAEHPTLCERCVKSLVLV